MNIVILAPHQDDEILSSCLYMDKLISSGYKVSVVFATNGDQKGSSVAALRAKESINALSCLNLLPDDVYFMGYADTGMRLEHSFLFKLYNCKTSQVYPSLYSNKTYHPLGLNTVHNMLFKKQALYTRTHFINDLEAILQYLQTDILIAPSRYDYHGDHKALGLFVSELIEQKELKIPLHTYLIHTDNNLMWPNQETDGFLRPACISQELWQTRIIHSFSQEALSRKLKIIQSFTSQLSLELNEYLFRFAKKQEFYLQENTIQSS